MGPMTDAPLPAPPPDDTDEVIQAIARARAELRSVRSELERVTGGARPGEVLAELAQSLSAELGAVFDELPMHRFSARIAAGGGLAGNLLRRTVPHRLLLGRYFQATVPTPAGVGYTTCQARIGVVAVGADGVLRIGEIWEQVILPADTGIPAEPLPWDDMRLQRVPSRAMKLERWTGRSDDPRLATPGAILEALTAAATAVADAARRDLKLLQRLL